MENLGRERFRVERRRCDALWGTIRRDIKSATAIGIYCRRLPDYRSKTRRARQPAAAAAATGMKLLESFNVLGPAGSSDRPRSGRPFAPGFLLQLEAEDCRVIRRLRHYTRFLLRTLREFKQRLQGVWKKRSKK